MSIEATVAIAGLLCGGVILLYALLRDDRKVVCKVKPSAWEKPPNIYDTKHMLEAMGYAKPEDIVEQWRDTAHLRAEIDRRLADSTAPSVVQQQFAEGDLLRIDNEDGVYRVMRVTADGLVTVDRPTAIPRSGEFNVCSTATPLVGDYRITPSMVERQFEAAWLGREYRGFGTHINTIKPRECPYCGGTAHRKHAFRDREVCSGCGAFWREHA